MLTAVHQLLTLLVLAETADAGDPPVDCAAVPQLLKDQDDRYWRVFRGEEPGDHLAEGRKAGALLWRQRECAARSKTTRVQTSKAEELSSPVIASQAAETDRAKPAKERRTLKGRSLAHDALATWACVAERERADVLKEIATERKYAKIGGALDLEKVHALQDKLRCLDDLIKAINRDSRKYPNARLPCNHPQMQPVIECIQAKWSLQISNWEEFLPAECQDPTTVQMLRVYDVNCD